MGSQLSHPSSLVPRRPHLLEEGSQAIEVLARLVVNDNLAAIEILGPDQDRCAQAAEQPLFEIDKMGGSGVETVGCVFADSGT
jgi:hypothetical protein